MDDDRAPGMGLGLYRRRSHGRYQHGFCSLFSFLLLRKSKRLSAYASGLDLLLSTFLLKRFSRNRVADPASLDLLLLFVHVG